MLTRWYLNGLLAVTVLAVVAVGGLWWQSVQPPELARAEAQTTRITLDNGLEAELIHDPDAPAADLTWTLEAGTRSDPDDFPGLHELFSRVVFYGEAPSGSRHLETRARRDPEGAVSLHVDRTHTRLDYRLSPSILADEINYLGELLRQPAIPLEAIAFERGQITGLDAAFGFLAPAEAAALQALMQDRDAAHQALQRDVESWRSLSNDGIARQLAQHANDYLAAQLMHVTVRAPAPLSELEEHVRSAFSGVRSNRAQPGAELTRSEFGRRLNDARYQPVVGAQAQFSDLTADVPPWRVLYPWRLDADQRTPARQLVAWLNASYEAAPARALHSAGLIEDLSAHSNDEFLVLDIVPTAQGRAEPERIYATLALFLAQVQNHSGAAMQVTRLAGDQRVASPLTIQGLDMDPSLFVHLDNLASGSDSARDLPALDRSAAVELSLPQSAPTRQSAIEDVPSNRYELLGWQPQLLVDEPAATLWHYEDNRFGSALASAHVRVEYPIGHDRRQQARWQQWAEHSGPGWTNRVLWTEHFATTPAQGLRVAVDAHGISWHFTDYWSEVEPWLYDFVQSLDGQAVVLPDSQLAESEPHQLLRERAGRVTVPPPEDLSAWRNTVLLSGRVAAPQATEFGQWLLSERTAPPAEPPGVLPLPQPLATRHQVAELASPGSRSRVTRLLQLPQNDLRQRTLADWTLPWLQETLTMAVRAEDFVGDLAIDLNAPLGHPGLNVQLSSTEQDPARLGLYLESFWRSLAGSVDGYPLPRFEESTHWRAALLRDSAHSLPALARFQWDDIVAGRQHFNGRILQARTLEGTNIEGWQYFARQWLFDGNARQLTVFEIGDEWAEDYEEARQMPPSAVAW